MGLKHEPRASRTARAAGERSLARRCRRLDRAALAEFFHACAPVVERLLGRIVGPSQVLEDLVQQTFVEAIKSFPSFRGEASLATWVSRIAVHVANRHFRQKTRRPVALELVAPGIEPPATTPSPFTLGEQHRLVRRLFALLDRLTPKKRIAFLLHVIEGYSVDETAALMGAGRSATRSRLWFARRELDSMIAEDPALREAALDLADLGGEGP